MERLDRYVISGSLSPSNQEAEVTSEQIEVIKNLIPLLGFEGIAFLPEEQPGTIIFSQDAPESNFRQNFGLAEYVGRLATLPELANLQLEGWVQFYSSQWGFENSHSIEVSDGVITHYEDRDGEFRETVVRLTVRSEPDILRRVQADPSFG